MKNKVIKVVLAHICIAAIATQLMGCGNIGIIVPGSGTEAEAQEDQKVADDDSFKPNFDFPDLDKTNSTDEDTDESEEITEEVTEEPDDYDDIQDDGTDASDSEFYMSPETRAALAKLDTDLSKVQWGLQYSPTGMDHIVISLIPYFGDGYYHLLMAVTNLYYEPIIFDASGYAKGFDGENISDISFYEPIIAPGNSAIFDILCSDIPSGEIHWDTIETPDAYMTDAYWECDWGVGKDDGNMMLYYNMYSTDEFTPGTVTALVLDEKGVVIDYASEYNADEGTTVSGTLEFNKSDYNGRYADIALFANPTIVE